MTRGFVLDATGTIKWSWRWAEPGPSLIGLPVEPGDQIVYLPDDVDDAVAFDIHTTVGHGWTWAEIGPSLRGDACDVVTVPGDLPPPARGRQLEVVTGARAIVERVTRLDGPRSKSKADILARRAEEEGPELRALLPGSTVLAGLGGWLPEDPPPAPPPAAEEA